MALRPHSAFLVVLWLAGCGARSPLSGGVGEDDAGADAAGCVPAPETCDGVDQDCDGRVDEDIDPVVCGPDICPTTVRCERGMMPACEPGPIAEERCNGIDDDCDERLDEGLGFGPLGDFHVVREDEFDTGDCISCSWAFGTSLTKVGDGLLAVWNLGLYGGAERPNLYGRRLDAFGAPTGSIELLRDDFILNMDPVPANAPLPARGTPLQAFFRVGVRDLFGLLWASDSVSLEYPLAPFAARNVDVMAWSGQRFFGFWNAAGSDRAIDIVSYDEDGGDERFLDPGPIDGIASHPALGVYPGRVGALIPVFHREDDSREQWLILLDATGRLLSAQHAEVPYVNWQRLVGISTGWIRIDPEGFGEPATWQLLSPEGVVQTDPRPFDDARSLSDSGSTDLFMPLPERAAVFAAWQSTSDQPDSDLHVEILEEDLSVRQAWSGPMPIPLDDGGYFADAHVVAYDDHFVLIWHTGADNGEPNTVLTLSLGCMEP